MSCVIVFFLNANRFQLKNYGEIMEDHKMSSKDKLVLGITLAAIFGGVFVLGFVGLVVNIFG